MTRALPGLLSPAALLAVATAGATGALLVPTSGARLRGRLVPAERGRPSRASPRPTPPGAARTAVPRRRPVLAAGLLAVLLLAVVVAAAHSAVPVLPLVAAPIGMLALHRRRAAAARALAERRRAAVAELLVALVAELRAGRAPTAALVVVAEAAPAALRDVLGSVVSVARADGDVARAVIETSRTPGVEGLRRLAVCWQVASETGAGLSTALERIVAGLRAEAASRREVAAQLAAPRATARVLAALPAFAVLLGTGLGASPLQVLLHRPIGVGCLVAGSALTAAGLAWTDRLAVAATGRSS